MALYPSTHAGLVLYLVLLICAFVGVFRRRTNYPPGPNGLPLIGIAHKHPKTEYWKTYARWGEEYGMSSIGDCGLLSFHVLGRRIVVLNTLENAEDLLVQRSSVYSDRPFPAMAKLMKREKSMFYISHNERFKIYRRLLQRDFNLVASQKYWGLLEEQAQQLVANIDRDSRNLFHYLRRNAAAVTMMVAYGYRVEDRNDYFVELAEEAMRVGSLAGSPGKWMVDSIPLLQYIPSWFPGAYFKRQAKEWGDQLYAQSLIPHKWVKQQMAEGSWTPSFTSNLLESRDGRVSAEDHEDLILWTAGAVYAAGADTSVASIKAFIFAMMLYPDIQAQAQAEVDSFISAEHRLPTLRDRASLRYLEAIMKEVIRWAPPAPMGLFHCTAVDDEYKGYIIPAKTTVIANVWAMLHDPKQYPEPSKFDPGRFYAASSAQLQRNPLDIAFGFGRRVCPGQHIAEATIFIQMALFISMLCITKAVDANGQVIDPEISFSTAIVSHVKQFQYKINRRSGPGAEFLKGHIDS